VERAESGAVCGALGCRESPEWVVTHPDYGRRTLCPEHAHDLLHKPPSGRESGGASRERSERASVERPEARERRSRRKRGLAPDPEARPQEAPARGRHREAGRSR